MKEKLNRLKELLGEVFDLKIGAAVLSWDQQTYMPKGGASDRSHAISAISSLAHEKFISPEIDGLLTSLNEIALTPDSDEARLLKVTRRVYDKKTKVPTDFVAEFAKITALGNHAWEKAREENDFKQFQPHLEKIVEMVRQYADFFAPYDHVYDPLLDEFEPGLKTADVQRIFSALRPKQVELIKKISEHPQVDDTFLKQEFDLQKQWDFGVELATAFGFDWNRGRQDKTAHPFTTTFGLGDVRITTRIYPNLLSSGLFSTMHETGHALYEQGVSQDLARTPLQDGASLAIHESQSRLWENLVGRSRDFWTCYYPKLQNTFPSQLNNISLDTFYRGINRAEPSLIRVESDEATYNLHIMLRLELEIALLEGTVAVADLPEIWNAKMEEYLGVKPENDAEGVMQDVHWSYGAIGYFSTYALGNLISAQLWECIHRDISNLPEQIQQGNFAELLNWLREKIHCHGAKFEPQELVEKVTGNQIDPEPYLRYLEEKFGGIYGF